MSTNCISCIKNERTESDLLCDDCRMAEITEAIENIKSYRQIHIAWAKHFKVNPDIEKKYVETGEWDSAKAHYEYANQYDKVLRLLAYLKAKENSK